MILGVSDDEENVEVSRKAQANEPEDDVNASDSEMPRIWKELQDEAIVPAGEHSDSNDDKNTDESDEKC